MINKDTLIQAITETEKKTFTAEEIIRIINVVSSETKQEVVESEGVKLDPSTYRVTKDDKEYRLPKKEFKLLYYFISNKNKVIVRDKILRDIWGTDVIVLDRTIDVHIRKIRSVIGDKNLQTKKSVGYGWFEN